LTAALNTLAFGLDTTRPVQTGIERRKRFCDFAANFQRRSKVRLTGNSVTNRRFRTTSRS
jgi:hypothetical protein